MRLSRTGIPLLALVASALIVPTAQARPAPTPWGPVHRVAAEIVRRNVEVATSDLGMSVIAWRARTSRGLAAHAAVRSRAGHWSAPIRLSDPGERVAELTTVSWGVGNVSVVWEREVSPDNWQFRTRTVGSDGAWRPVRTLLTAGYAFPSFKVDVNDVGAILLSWEGGDHHVRAAVLGTDGPWRRLRPIGVRSPGTTLRFTDNPQAAFLADNGDVRVITWGRHRGTKGKALWSARFTGSGNWRFARIGPTGGDQLEYNWIGQARFAADARGDFAAVWSQQNPRTQLWTTRLRYDPAGGEPTRLRTLGHARCDRDWRWCADIAVAEDGTAIVAWPRRGSDAQSVFVARKPRHGTLTRTQRLYTEAVSYVFSGVAVDANARGDAVVNFIGGNKHVFMQEFARCPAVGRCRQPLQTPNDAPSWLDPVSLSVAPNGDALASWATGCGGGDEACWATHVWARRLKAVR